MTTRGEERLAWIVESFISGQSLDEIRESIGISRTTIEAVIRQAMKLADRKGSR